jgi:hypothetical protein
MNKPIGVIMSFEVWLSGLAIVFSIISFTLSFLQSRKSSITDIRPVIVFTYESQEGWKIRNVGSGPALNIIVAMSLVHEDEWTMPVRLPALSVNSETALHWIGHLNIRALAAKYTDFENRKYSLTAMDDFTKVHGTDILPSWNSSESTPYWIKPKAR